MSAELPTSQREISSVSCRMRHGSNGDMTASLASYCNRIAFATNKCSDQSLAMDTRIGKQRFLSQLARSPRDPQER